MQDDKPFVLRAYAKQELALMYFPDAMPHVAVNRLGSWIKRNKLLTAALRRLHYNKYSKYFTTREVSKIIYYLGPP